MVVKLVIALSLAIAAAGCSTAIDAIPPWAGGEPAGTPQRLATELEYPPVHDRPPGRDTKPVTVEEQKKIEGDLAARREAQTKQANQVKKDRAGMLANPPKPYAPPPTSTAAPPAPGS